MIEFLREVFAANRIIILFVYGQVFFVLALAIGLQSWRHSRLALARSLQWLAAFGLTHGSYEWGDLFIPFQAQYLPAPLVDFLRTIQAILLAISFTCLFQFGVEALRPLPGRWRRLRYLPASMLLIWVGFAFGPALIATRSIAEWHSIIAIGARYAIAFPGGLLAAYGLWHQGAQIATDLQLPRMVRPLQIGALALLGYGIMTGLVDLPKPFFPANWLNTVAVERLLIIPVPLFRGLLGLVLTVSIIRSLEAFRVELDRRLARMEEAQVLAAERDRIGREIHDGTLQTIYAAGLLLQTVERDLARSSDEPRSNGITATSARLRQSVELLNQAVADIRGYIGALREKPDSRSLTVGLQELARDRHLRSLVEVDLALNIPEGQSLAPSQIGHLLAIANEALSNVARHSHATRVHLSASVSDGRLHLKIRDNGHGMRDDYVIGYGLRNMRDRARMLGGDLLIDSQLNHGTTVAVDVPWREEHERVATTAG